MKLLYFVTASALMFACKSSKSSQVLSNQISSQLFSIEIYQEGKKITQIGEEIFLKKIPFILYVNFYNTYGVDVSASWGRHYYDFPDSENIYNCNIENYSDDCRFWSMKAGAEEKYNEDKNILVGDDSYQVYWAYDDQDYWKDFNKIDSTQKDMVIGTMIVENIFDLDIRDLRKFEESVYHYPIEKIDKDIFFVFATSHKEKDMQFAKELQREKFILRFE